MKVLERTLCGVTVSILELKSDEEAETAAKVLDFILETPELCTGNYSVQVREIDIWKEYGC